MRSTITALFLALGACEGPNASNPPAAPESYAPMSSSSRVAALFAPPSDAEPATSPRSLDAVHALTITTCASSPQLCRTSDADTAVDSGYRILRGSGHAVLRTRDQSVAELYNELRDRTGAGERLDAEPRPIANTGGNAGVAPAHVSNKGSSSGSGADPLATCALQLLGVVDDAGEITLDVVHGTGARGCTVALGGGATDGGTGQCLIQAPESARPHGQGRRGH